MAIGIIIECSERSMELDRTKLVSDKASFKPISSVTETSEIIEISTQAYILSEKQITKALIRLHGCAH